MTGTGLIHIFEYDEWATNRLLDAASKLTAQDFKKDLGASFHSLHGTLAHIYGAQRIWLHRWNGSGQPGMISPEEAPTVEDLKKRWQQLYRGQVASLIRQLGQTPPQTDLIAYYRSR